MNPLVSEKLSSPPILVVDEEGIIGEKLIKRLSQGAQIVFVTSKEGSEKDVVYVPFRKTNPLIPNSFYSHIVLINPENFGESINSFLEKARGDRSSFIVCSHFKNAKQILDNNPFDYSGTKLIFFGDLFNNKPLNLETPSIITRFLNQARIRGRIDIPGDGTDLTYPVFLEDFLDSILEIAFGLSKDKVFYLFPKHGITLLKLANLVQRNDPSITIDFTEREEIEKPDIDKEGTYLLPENYKLDKKILSLNLKAGSHKENNIPQEIILKKKESSIRIVLFAVILFFFLPIITTLLSTIIGEVFLSSVKTSLTNGRQSLYISKSFFSLSSKTSKVLAYETQFLPFSFSKDITGIIDNGIKESSMIDEFYKAEDAVFSGNAKNGIDHINNFLLFEELQKSITGRYSVVDNGLFNIISSTFTVWPDLFGLNGAKRYLILLTNNKSMLPGGGDIEAFATFGLDNGKLSYFNVSNPSDSDKNLKGHVEPPFFVRRYFKQTGLLLKNSNTSPDFTESASSSAFFVNTEEGSSIDGVFVIDNNFLKKFLDNSSIFLKKLNVEINSNNLDGFLNEHKDDEDFFAQILLAMKDKISDDPAALISSISESLLKKDLVAAFADPKVQSVFTINNYSGSLLDDRDVSANSFEDFLGIIDSTFPNSTILNKRVQQTSTIGNDGSLANDLIVQYQGGDQDTGLYLEFVLPPGTTLNKIKLNGAEQNLIAPQKDPNIYESKDFQEPQGLEVDKSSDKGKSIFSFPVAVAQKKDLTIELQYTNSGLGQVNKNLGYSLRVFKQVGASSYPLNLQVNYPSSLTPGSKPKGSLQEDGNIKISKDIDKDTDLNFLFINK